MRPRRVAGDGAAESSYTHSSSTFCSCCCLWPSFFFKSLVLRPYRILCSIILDTPACLLCSACLCTNTYRSTGIYSLVGIGAQTAGPAISVSFGLCGVACCFTSLSYAEFAARIPMAGSAYTFTYVSFGELAGWLVGWNLTLGYAVSAAAVARSWAVYVAGFVQGVVTTTDDDGGGGRGGVLPTVVTLLDALLQWLVKAPVPTLGSRDAEAAEATTCCPLAALVIVLCTLVLISGAKESARFNTIMTILNLSVLTFVVVAGLLTGSVRWDNLGLTTFSDAEEDTATATATTSSYSASFFGTNGFDGVGRAAGLVFFSYLGFDMVSCLSEEVINPEKNMPIGTLSLFLFYIYIYSNSYCYLLSGVLVCETFTAVV